LAVAATDGGRQQRRVVIACQGGGSHTAFTAGVLKRLLGAKELAGYQVSGLSGTSGGAVCALLAWYALLDDDPAGAGRHTRAEPSPGGPRCAPTGRPCSRGSPTSTPRSAGRSRMVRRPERKGVGGAPSVTGRPLRCAG